MRALIPASNPGQPFLFRHRCIVPGVQAAGAFKGIGAPFGEINNLLRDIDRLQRDFQIRPRPADAPQNRLDLGAFAARQH